VNELPKESRGIRLYPRQWKSIDNAAKELGMTRNRLIEVAIREYMMKALKKQGGMINEHRNV